MLSRIQQKYVCFFDRLYIYYIFGTHFAMKVFRNKEITLKIYIIYIINKKT